VLVSVPNAALVEVLAGAPAELWKEPPEVKNGMMAPPNRPGHGMEFSAEALKRFTE
jgi:L-alanine-DL-glutamate epimerase-like enolase superfamily enzyme